MREPTAESLALADEIFSIDFFEGLDDEWRQTAARRIDAHVAERTASLVDAWNATCLERETLRAVADAMARRVENLQHSRPNDDSTRYLQSALLAYRALSPGDAK